MNIHEKEQVSRGPCPLAGRPRRVLGRGGARDRLDRAGQEDLRSLDGRVWPLVCRRRGQHLLQRARPSCRERPRRPGGADPRFAADQHGLEIHLCRDAERGAGARRRHAGFRRRQGRPRHPLYAAGAGSRVRDAGLRADRRGAFGGVRRLRGQGAGDPDRGRQAEADLLGELRDRARPHRRNTSRCSTRRSACPASSRRAASSCSGRSMAANSWPAAITTGRRCAVPRSMPARLRRACRCWRPIRSTFSTRPAPRAFPRASCATMAVIWSR